MLKDALHRIAFMAVAFAVNHAASIGWFLTGIAVGAWWF